MQQHIHPQVSAISSPDPSAPSVPITDRIATAAYYRAEKRGFTPGAELDDWLEAEREISVTKHGES